MNTQKKTCKKCGEEKPLTEFYKKDGGKLGVHTNCKLCHKVYNVAYVAVDENRTRNYNRIKERLRTEPLYKLIHNLRNTVSRATKPYGKDSSTAHILGCSFEEVYDHINRLLPDNTTMDMLGISIHIDHFIPLSSATSKEHAIALSNYRNLRPLRADLNLKKSDNMPYEIIDGEIIPFFEEDMEYIINNFEYFQSLMEG